jgi:hypothetical protein
MEIILDIQLEPHHPARHPISRAGWGGNAGVGAIIVKGELRAEIDTTRAPVFPETDGGGLFKCSLGMGDLRSNGQGGAQSYSQTVACSIDERGIGNSLYRLLHRMKLPSVDWELSDFQRAFPAYERYVPPTTT